jgi:hypothetical protein
VETADPKNIAPFERKPLTPEEQLSEVFGSYKAEWLRERLFEFFTAPNYLPELMTPRPCVLMGGRGTGKTTVLRGLSYEGQFALTGGDARTIPDWKHFGIYFRVNTNRVMAFSGPEVEASMWNKLFGHYLNLVLVDHAVRFLSWFKLYTSLDVELDPRRVADVSSSLHLAPTSSIRELAESLRSARISFEAFINNVADTPRPLLSMQGSALDVLFEAISELTPFRDKVFFFLVDEYENLQDYQQQLLNTLIKHSGKWYTFKIGVRELGWRVRSTLNENEQLVSPADYVRINIVERLAGNTFKDFARSVCNSRLAAIRVGDHPTNGNIEAVFPGLTEDEEAEKLGVREVIRDFQVEATGRTLLEPVVESLTPLQMFLLKTWASAQGTSYAEVLTEYRKEPHKWRERFVNYQHALLFSIRRRKRGIRKYYCGWDVFTQLAASNIRYLIELVDQSLLLHLREGGALNSPVSAETQTTAAQAVGRKNVSELEGLSVYGAQLTKLVLGLGRVFQILAAEPVGHAPEVNQFHISDDGNHGAGTDFPEEEVDRLVKSAVMHLALIRFPANKLADEGETRDYDYMIHPIFSPFFVFSHRHKRKMVLSAADLIGLVREPHKFIPTILGRHNRSTDEELPDQMMLFQRYYGRPS